MKKKTKRLVLSRETLYSPVAWRLDRARVWGGLSGTRPCRISTNNCTAETDALCYQTGITSGPEIQIQEP